MNFNYYTVLGVSHNATAKEIKMAFKRLAIQYHPDKHQGLTHYEEKFKLVNEAYQVLSDERKRAIYDLKLQYLLQQQLIQKQQQQQQMRYQQTRRPAPVSERYYKPRPVYIRRFSRRDYLIVFAIFASIFVFGMLLKLVMDHVSGVDKYKTAQTYLQSERWSSAHSLLSEAIYFKPEYAEAYLQRAEIEQNIYKNYAAAVADYNAVIAYADTVLPDVYFNRGKCYYQLEQFQKAEQDMSKTLLLTNAIPNAYFTRGEVRLLYLRKFPEAVADFTSYLQTGSGTNVQRGEALMYRGFAQYMTRQYPAAISDFEQSLAADSLNARTYYLYGKAEAALQDTGSACRHFVRSYNLGYAAAELDLKELCLNKRYK